MAIRFFSTHLYWSLLILSIYLHASDATQNYNVLKFGAKGNGVTDSTQAFIKAWAAACGSEESTTIYVPKGRHLLGSMAFKGDCKNSDITIRIDGTLVAPADYRILGQADNWLSFEGVSGVSIIGGALDAKGTALWNCKDKGTKCPNGATSLRFTNSNNIKINGLLSLNSQMFHIVFNGCQNVRVEGVRVIAAEIALTQMNLWVEVVTCGPGHGISIGSLAKDMDEEGVQNVTIKNTTFIGTQNGLRIKSWARPSNGFVQGIRFIDVVMRNVQNPIIIDQNYCPHNLNCPGR
ncbi:hypothetical protein Pint_24955 [Pistacia integerrima]|uniref:Uncharacterized protein n=1 Tax=Pistacia integerrima TaxID=434235 RepID=A0ACC0YH99_9ROSI|nr:hypothetical protein Pint_24955 [Pistacia integerrima]